MGTTSNPHPLTPPPRSWQSLPLGERTIIVGLIDSMTSAEGGDPAVDETVRVVDVGRRLVALGADALEFGDASGRRAAAAEDNRHEVRRLLASVEAVAGEIAVPIVVRASTSHLARAAVTVGASIVRGVSELHADPSLARVVLEEGVALIVGPQMGGFSNTRMAPGAESVVDRLNESARLATDAGLARVAVWLDPDVDALNHADAAHAMIRCLDRIVALGHPVVVGPFGQRLVGAMPNRPGAESWEGAAAHLSLAIAAGVQVVRVHDVARLTRVTRMADAIVAAGARQSV